MGVTALDYTAPYRYKELRAVLFILMCSVTQQINVLWMTHLSKAHYFLLKLEDRICFQAVRPLKILAQTYTSSCGYWSFLYVLLEVCLLIQPWKLPAGTQSIYFSCYPQIVKPPLKSIAHTQQAIRKQSLFVISIPQIMLLIHTNMLTL